MESKPNKPQQIYAPAIPVIYAMELRTGFRELKSITKNITCCDVETPSKTAAEVINQRCCVIPNMAERNIGNKVAQEACFKARRKQEEARNKKIETHGRASGTNSPAVCVALILQRTLPIYP